MGVILMNNDQKLLEWELIWYNPDSEVTRDRVLASNEEEAIRKGYLKYGGPDKAPAKLVTAMRL